MIPSRPLAVSLTPLETRREVMLNVAVRAEELGYDAIFVGEAWGHDVSVVLTEIALRTSRIRIGAGVLNIWGRSAATIAMLATSLDELSGGRFVLGLGAGTPQLAEGLHDVAFHAPVERLGAVTRQVRRLLEGDRIEPSTKGGSRPLRLGVGPATGVPIQLAALGPNAVRLCGEQADGWFPFLLPASGIEDGMRLLEEGLAHGTPGRRIPQICPAVPTAVSTNPEHARATAAWWIAFYLTNMGALYGSTLRERGFGPAVDAVLNANPSRRTTTVPDEAQVLLDELTIWGNAADARAGLDAWYTAGAQMPVIVMPPHADIDALNYTLESLRPDLNSGSDRDDTPQAWVSTARH